MSKILNFRRFLVVAILQLVLVAGLFINHLDRNLSAIAATISKRDNFQVENKDAAPILEHDTPNAQKSGDVASGEETLTEKVTEKLNLTESLPPSTKKFFDQLQGKEPLGENPIPPAHEGE
ncbi:MAG: hypothetical protein N5P05_001162 [Chroococcopsis gigantea SAG 12.99]|jgi:hypothetical protein|nr:hypothetical protein [Chroococcopsis gigantea SAG 12.99]